MSKTLEMLQPPASQAGVAQRLEGAIQAAIAEARATCDLKGATSGDCAVAWDIVEELQAECSHRKAKKNSLERYCDENPDAVECRVYDI
ncbi:Calvin cycle protein CP12 [Oculatella sp. FACHB-28]|uniref:Calvin cycle protein CP12 n=1 Tax=Cyanophyceae TaxID=3028117 RepID=UPI001685CDC0|nr:MULTISPECIES: Calvin cycle protein CP12 [Cyanophyceae]MBD2057264.1 Calvin cycle protein CP12 [Oculatella sp. FACHB-28]MBD2072175.1 Calvin cycle protein CP12 [Leptolyngbya sp. FACHB-671]